MACTNFCFRGFSKRRYYRIKMELKEKIVNEIKKIYDPEIPVNIYELGLI